VSGRIRRHKTLKDRAAQALNGRETMPKSKTLRLGLVGAAALLMLGACTSPEEVSSLDDRVGEAV
jgi:hypothetical protein